MMKGGFLTVFLFVLGLAQGQLYQELLLPHANHVTNATSYLFQWNRNPTVPNQYRFQFSTDSSFTNNLIDDTTNAGSYLVNNLGPSNTRYYWRVKALNPATSWSWVRKFTYFNPNNLNGLVAWLNPSAGVSLSGTSVLGMTDQGVFNNNAFQSVLAQRPTYVPSDSIMNNQPSIKYDGSNDFIEMSDSPALDFTTEFTAHALVKPDIVAVNKTILAKWDYQTQGSWVWQTEYATADEYMFTPCFTVTDPGNQKVVTNNADMVAKKPTLMTLTYNANILARATYHKNFNLLSTTMVGTIPQFLPNSTATLKVGKYGGTATRYYQGDITEILLFNHAQTDTLRNLVDHYLRYKYCPPVNLGPDTIISPTGNCGNIQLKAAYRFSTYLWSTGSTASRIFVQQPGTYWVTVTDFMGNVSKDTIVVKPPYDFHNPSTSILCQGQSMIWTPNFPTPGFSFLWQNGSTAPSITITQPGAYFVKVTDNNGCFVRSDTLHVTLDNYPSTAFLGADTSLCIGNTLSLQAGANVTTNYLWNDGSTGSTFTVVNPGSYFVVLTSTNIHGCQAQDTIQISVAGHAPQVILTPPISACTNAPIVFGCSATVPLPSVIQTTQWIFSNGVSQSGSNVQFSETTPGTYLGTLTVTAQDNCKTQLPLTFTVVNPPNLGISHVGLCSNAPVSFSAMDSSGLGLVDYAWSFGQGLGFDTLAHPSFTYQSSGMQSSQLIAQSISGCSDTLQHTFSLFAAPSAAFSYSNVCEQSDILLINSSISNDTSSLVHFQWDFGDSIHSSLAQPFHAFHQEGIYTITLIAGAGNSCSDTVTHTINVRPKPDLSWVLGPSCKNNFTSFKSVSTIPSGSIDSTAWLVNLQFPFSGDSAAYLFTTLGVQYLELHTVSNLGCSRDTLILVTVHPGVISALDYQPLTLIAGDTLTLISQALGASNVAWWLNQVSIGVQDTVQYAVNDTLNGQELEVSLVAQNALGCSDTSSIMILVNDRILDLAVKQVFHNEINGQTVVGAELRNEGTMTINKAQLHLLFSGTELFNSPFNDTLLPGKSFYYLFPGSPNFSSMLQNETGDYFCVRGEVEPFYPFHEANLTNNIQCEVLENQTFELGFPTPNPANEEVSMTLVVNEASDITLQVFNSIGQETVKIMENQPFQPGTYQLSIPVNSWAIGCYFIHANSKDIHKMYQMLKITD